MIRNATPADFEAIVRLNAESEHFLSPLTREKLQMLHGAAAYHRVACVDGSVAAFFFGASRRRAVRKPQPRLRGEDGVAAGGAAVIPRRHIAFLHTSPVHVDTFSRPVNGAAPALKVEHVVAEDLLLRGRSSSCQRRLAS